MNTERVMTSSLTSPSHSISSTDGYEQVHRIYEQIFGIQSISKLNHEHITSGQLLNDIYIRIISENETTTNNNNNNNNPENDKTYKHKLQELIEITRYNKTSMNDEENNNDFWDILLPEYHINNKRKSLSSFNNKISMLPSSSSMIEWHRLLQVFRIIKYYLGQTLSSTPTPNKDIINIDDSNSNSNHSNESSSNQNINIIDNRIKNLSQNLFSMQSNTYFDETKQTEKLRAINLTSFTPPTTKCNNLSQTTFLTQQQNRVYRQINFNHNNNNNNNNNNINSNDKMPNIPSSPPPNQILLSAKKAMSTIRGKNLDAAILASGRKMYKNVMPKPTRNKTKKCTPGKKEENKIYSQTPSANNINNNNVSKKLQFIHEEEEDDHDDDDDDDDEHDDDDINDIDMNDQRSSISSMTSHYGWKARENDEIDKDLKDKGEKSSVDISMLSHVLVDIVSSNNEESVDLNETIKLLNVEIAEKDCLIQEYENRLSDKSKHCRDIEQELQGYKQKCTQFEEKCKKFDEMQEENKTMDSKISLLIDENKSLNDLNNSLKNDLEIKTKEYESKCHSFIEELSKKENEIKHKDSENIRFENDISTLRARLDYFKNRVSKIGKISLCKSQLLRVTADYKSLKKTVSFNLQRHEQEFVCMAKTIKNGLLEGPNNVSHNFLNTMNCDDEIPQFLKPENSIKHMEKERDELKKNWQHLNISYQNEKKLRKKLLEQVIDLKGNIRVFCRVRPKINRKITASNDNNNDGDKPELMATTCLDDERIVINDENKKEFTFDHIYQPATKQDVIFEDVKPLIHSAVDGYNVCIFAYGQTGSGKTYTMEGTQSNRGIIYRSFDELFILKRKEMKIYLSCLEIYNEKIRDLLITKQQQQQQQLKAKLSKCGKKVLVPGLTKIEVLSTENVRNTLINNAYKNRSTGITNMNEHSSRSHALVFVDIITEKTSSRLVLIDLAGSERVKKTGVSGTAFDEARNINKSLSALGNVINSLQTKQKHIPFRDSQLTYLLYDCLGGNSKALMVCNISCEIFDIKESINTLIFANRVRRVQLGEAQKNDNNDNNHNNNNNNNNNHNNNNNNDSLTKQKLKKYKKDLEEKEKEINHLKMNNRNNKKEINKLMSSIGAQNNKNANHHQTRMEYNNLQKEHTRTIQDNEKKDKLIKKLTNDINEYKHKFNHLKQQKTMSSLTINNRANRSSLTINNRTNNIRIKNPRKRKLPKDDETTNDNVNNTNNKNTMNGPAPKRRKMNNHNNRNNKVNNNRNNNNNKRVKTKQIPSYQAPIRNSRDKTRTFAKSTSSSRSRSISLDSKYKNNANSNSNKKNNNNNYIKKNIHNTRKKRTSSLDSVLNINHNVKNTKNNNKALKTTAPLTPLSAIEALKNGQIKTNITIKKDGGNNKNNNNINHNKYKENDNVTNNNNNNNIDKAKQRAPFTVTSLTLQSAKNNAFK